MRILLLCTDAYGGHGGIALYNRDLAAALASDPACQDLVVIPRVMQGEPGDIPEKVRFIAEAARGRVAYARAIASARVERFDLVICGHVNLLPVACMLTVHPLLMAYGIESWKPFRSSLSRTLLHRCRAVISISQITRDRLLGWSRFSGATYLLPNAVHLEQYGISPRRTDMVEQYGLAGKRVLLTVGRLHPAERYKGFDEVIEILPELDPGVVYLVAGGGDDVQRLKEKAAATGVAERVIFTGLFAESMKPDLYNLADVYVMPSRGEGFGFVFLEAAACGVPVIGSRLDGGREALLDGEIGLLVDPTNLADLLAKTRELLSAPKREVAARLDHFSFENFTRRAQGIVHSALASARGHDTSGL